MRVVAPAAELPVALPQGERDAYPVKLAHLTALAEAHSLTSACDRLVQALAGNRVSA